MAAAYKISKKGGYDPAHFHPEDTGKFKSRKEAEIKMAHNLEKINELQQKLYADGKEGVIFVFQAMDAAGKDGTIRAVLSCLSPHGVEECAFKTPSAEELGHDFLWRIHNSVPEKGHIAIFNRSHYEDVLIGKVHSLYKNQAKADRIKNDDIIARRYADIRNFEEYLYNNSIRMVKIFLNVSNTAQAARFLSRIEDPAKNWKFSMGDMKEREYWDDYQKAFADAINETATKHCPWYIVPADHKWYMRYLVSEIILENLQDMNPQWPTVDKAAMATYNTCREQLEKACGKAKKSEAAEKDIAKSAEKSIKKSPKEAVPKAAGTPAAKKATVKKPAAKKPATKKPAQKKASTPKTATAPKKAE